MPMSTNDGKEKHYVFKPIKGTSQEIALACPCDSILLCGTRGGAKTLTQLMLFRKNVGKGYGSYWRGVIFDVEYKDLEDVVIQSERFFLAFEDGAKFLKSMSQYKWVWPTGEELLFRTGETVDDYLGHHGKEYPFIGVNELSKQYSPAFVDSIMSCNRSSFISEEHSPIDRDGNRRLIPDIPLRFVATTNPFGVGRAWIKKRYIDPAPYGHVIRTKIKVLSPKTKKEEIVERNHVSLFSSYIENPYLSEKYIAILHTEKNKNKRAAWLGGSWNQSAGGAIDDLWRDDVHIIDRFDIPLTWFVDRSMDWGSTHPFSVNWWAESNGEEVILPNGKIFCPAPGSIIMIAEWYGSKEEDWGENKGLRIGSGEVADGILEIEKYLYSTGFVKSTIYPGPADNQIRNVTDKSQQTIEFTMQERGVTWLSSDKSDGSRKNGYLLFRERLEASVKKEGKGFYVMRNCRAFIHLTPSIPPHPVKIDDVDDRYEDHSYDSTRYKILHSSKRLAGAIPVTYPR